MNCNYCNDSKFDPDDERRPCAHCADACTCCPKCQGRGLCKSCGEPPCTYCAEDLAHEEAAHAAVARQTISEEED